MPLTSARDLTDWWFENYIRVWQLWEASVFDDADADKLHEIFRRCSGGQDGHDHSVSASVSSPHFCEMEQLLDDLTDLIKSVHFKRDQLKRHRQRSRNSSGQNTFTPDF